MSNDSLIWEMDLFDVNPVQPRLVSDYVESNDVKGLIAYLKSLEEKVFRIQVLQAGFSMIGFNHGKQRVIEHVVRQIQK